MTTESATGGGAEDARGSGLLVSRSTIAGTSGGGAEVARDLEILSGWTAVVGAGAAIICGAAFGTTDDAVIGPAELFWSSRIGAVDAGTNFSWSKALWLKVSGCAGSAVAGSPDNR